MNRVGCPGVTKLSPFLTFDLVMSIEPNQTQFDQKPWIALNIGNSRLHWAWFLEASLQETWETPHQTATEINSSGDILAWQTLPPNLSDYWGRESNQLPEIWIASVVPEQTELWQSYPGSKIITLDQIPLQAAYPTLGVDRALAVWEAGETWGWPTLVIDAGTALTFTGADANHKLVGGAILPGLGLQVRSLARSTATLPLVELPGYLPSRWATNTSEAVQSGIAYTVLAGVRDFIQAWQQKFPQSQIVLTGGDQATLQNYLQAWSTQGSQTPEWTPWIISAPNLVFLGIQSLRRWLKFA